MVRAFSDAELRELAAQGRTELQAALRSMEPEVKNLDVVGERNEPLFLRFAGHTYAVPPVGLDLGVKLYALRVRLRNVPDDDDSAEVAAAEAAICMEAVELFPLAFRPVDWRRWVWGYLPNPFRKMSAAEVAQALFICLRSRGSSRLQLVSPKDRPRRRTS